MRLVTFLSDNGPRAGSFVSEGTIVPICGLVPDGQTDMLRVIEGFNPPREGIRTAATCARGGVNPSRASSSRRSACRAATCSASARDVGGITADVALESELKPSYRS